jgi:hypothetical protein
MVAPNHATLFLDFEQENPATYNLNKNKTLPKKGTERNNTEKTTRKRKKRRNK